MATATMATAAGAAALLYFTLNHSPPPNSSSDDDRIDDANLPSDVSLGIERISHRLIQAPATWFETISTLAETLRFTYSETLGKWPITDLAFGISFLLKRQGNLHHGVFGGKDSVELSGTQITNELKYLLKLLILCRHFSKKLFPLFLEETGYSEENVLLQEPKAGILKPAFTILVDHETKCFLLLIRGTHSIKDTLTVATGAVVPFHHTVVNEGGVRNLVLGYAHCGMVAAARWIAKLATPRLKKALDQYPDYRLKIVGHSLGGGTAALLAYVLREQKELSTTTCVAFAPAGCMTWELAESGKDFIISVINGADLVPTFSAASVDDLRAEVTASAWINDLRNQIEGTRILSTVYRSASALGSRLPSIASARATVAGAGALLRPVSCGTQVVMKRAQSMAQAAWTTRPSLRSFSCIGPHNRATSALPNPSDTISQNTPKDEASEPLTPLDLPVCSEGQEWNNPPNLDDDVDPRTEDHMNGVDMWQQLEHEIRQEEAVAMADLSLPETKQVHRFYPPGKIMHIVTLQFESEDTENRESKVGIFLTPTSLYSKLRLSQTMVNDHFMPVYIRQMEKLIQQLENREADDSRSFPFLN